VEAAESAAFAGAAAGAAAASVDLAGAEAITVPAGGVAPVSADAGRKLIVSFVITRVSFAEFFFCSFAFRAASATEDAGIVLRLRSQSRRQAPMASRAAIEPIESVRVL